VQPKFRKGMPRSKVEKENPEEGVLSLSAQLVFEDREGALCVNDKIGRQKVVDYIPAEDLRNPLRLVCALPRDFL
jgi:hypothetical protein